MIAHRDRAGGPPCPGAWPVTVLIENVRHHVKEEEQDWFPQVRKAMGTKALRQLGEELAASKSRAPADPLRNPSASA
jgi:hypothetical protein